MTIGNVIGTERFAEGNRAMRLIGLLPPEEGVSIFNLANL